MRNLARGAAAALFSAALVTACDNPVGDRETHVRPATMAIFDGSTELVRGSFTGITQALTVGAGVDTRPLTVRFFNSAGTQINPGVDYHLRVTGGSSGGTVIAHWIQDSAGDFGGRLRGVATGSTTLTFGFIHGAPGTGHSEADFVVPVTITGGAPE
ncbi:MAG TPA: hypothetical protein VMN60_05265 [Longimicrobiales bacterium]|nr:hypothetical protein [Longimicrobiales bacterium]